MFCVAVHALIYLNRRGCMLSSEELAENICTNPARVRKVMLKLKQDGLVATRTGTDGGYRLLVSLHEVSLLRIADALGIRFVEPAWHSGGIDKACMVASGMAGVMDELFEGLNRCCRMKLGQICLSYLEQKLERK